MGAGQMAVRALGVEVPREGQAGGMQRLTAVTLYHTDWYGRM